MKKAALGILVLFAAILIAQPAHSGSESDMNALLVIASKTEAFDADFQKYLADNGARIIKAFPPHAFMGYVPWALDKTLAERYGATVYRGRIEDMDRLAKYGESIFLAANEWNKRCQEDPPEAPLVISHKVLRARKGEAIVLSWNDVMKAAEYRLEISRGREFRELILKATPAGSRYELYSAFLADGVYYWRVAAFLTLNNGERVQSRFSDVFSFAVSKPAAAKTVPAPKLPKNMAVKGGEPLAWKKNPDFKYYRVQVGGTKEFSDLVADDFTDTNSYRTAGLPLEYGATYYLRLMGAGGAAAGPWSEPCEVWIGHPAR